LNTIRCPGVKKKESVLSATWLCYKEYWQTFIRCWRTFRYGNGEHGILIVKATKECRHGEEGVEEETNVALKEIRRICAATGLTMPEIAIQWILENPLSRAPLLFQKCQRIGSQCEVRREPLSKEMKAELDRITLPVMEKLGNHFDYYEKR